MSFPPRGTSQSRAKELTRDARVTSYTFLVSTAEEFALSRHTKRCCRRSYLASYSFIFRSVALWVRAVSRPLLPLHPIRAAGIVEEVCFDRIKCNFRVPSTAFSLERLSAKPISCCKLWMELMPSKKGEGDEKTTRFLHSSRDIIWALSSRSHTTCVQSYLTLCPRLQFNCNCVNVYWTAL